MSAEAPRADVHHLARTDETAMFERLSRSNFVTTWRWYLGVLVTGPCSSGAWSPSCT